MERWQLVIFKVSWEREMVYIFSSLLFGQQRSHLTPCTILMIPVVTLIKSIISNALLYEFEKDGYIPRSTRNRGCSHWFCFLSCLFFFCHFFFFWFLIRNIRLYKSVLLHNHVWHLFEINNGKVAWQITEYREIFAMLRQKSQIQEATYVICMCKTIS